MEFSHFGASLSNEATIDLMLGTQLYAALKQPPEELHSLAGQQLILETILAGKGTTALDVAVLKESAAKVAAQAKDEKDFDRLEAELLKKSGPHYTLASKETPQPVNTAPQEPGDSKAKEKSNAKS
jgi:hypothetical protein